MPGTSTRQGIKQDLNARLKGTAHTDFECLTGQTLTSSARVLRSFVQRTCFRFRHCRYSLPDTVPQATGGLCAASTGKAHQPPGKNNRTSDKPLCGRNPPNSTKHDKQESFIMAKFYCKYCGNAYSSVQSLTSTTCPRHPDGVGKGRHALYEGDEAPEYTCKYCGKRASTIASLTSQMCPRHPDGNGKGRHSPAL